MKETVAMFYLAFGPMITFLAIYGWMRASYWKKKYRQQMDSIYQYNLHEVLYQQSATQARQKAKAANVR